MPESSSRLATVGRRVSDLGAVVGWGQAEIAFDELEKRKVQGPVHERPIRLEVCDLGA
jgi:hypothetical protein